VDFYVKDEYFCTGFAKTVKTMNMGGNALLIVKPQYSLKPKGYEIIFSLCI